MMRLVRDLLLDAGIVAIVSALLALWLFGVSGCSQGGDRWEFHAAGQGQARCACAPSYKEGSFIARPDLPESTWAGQRVLKIIVQSDGPDAGLEGGR